VRNGLSVEELGDFLEQPFNATLATYRRDGSVLLSPVWHEWRDGGFSIFTGENDVKLRHLERRSQASVVVSDNLPPLRGIEVSASPTIIRDPEFARETLQRITFRYLGPELGSAYANRSRTSNLVVIRLVPGTLRTWDFVDDEILSGAH
jgi:PPOX class probable F420-dependent enzyme